MPCVKYVSLAEPSGYGLSAAEYVLGLRDAGISVSWTPLFPSATGYAPASSFEEAARRLRNIPLPRGIDALLDRTSRSDDDAVHVLHTVPEYWPDLRTNARRTFGYTVWETTAVPPHWAPLLSAVDGLLTPSRFSADALGAATDTPIHVVPHVHRAPTPDASGRRFRELHDVPQEDLVFYTIGEWNARKAMWTTLHAYCSAFTSRDPTTLVVKTNQAGPAHANDGQMHPVQVLVQRIVDSYPDAPHVCLITRTMTQAEIDELHAAGDCYVALPAAEGWALGAFDAACASRPVIITGWGGQMDYLGDDALPVAYDLVPVRSKLGGTSYRPDQQWALPSIEQAVDRLQWVRANRDEAAAMGLRLGTKLRSRYSRLNVIETLAKILRAA